MMKLVLSATITTACYLSAEELGQMWHAIRETRTFVESGWVLVKVIFIHTNSDHTFSNGCMNFSMMVSLRFVAAVFLLIAQVNTENSTVSEDTCPLEPWDNGPWSQLLEDWATAPVQSDRHVIVAGAPPRGYEEWQASPPPPPNAGKIVNRPPNPYKDKFKPSFPPPSPNQPIPVHGHPQPPYNHYPAADRVDESKPTPQKQVSETDLYLLGAIEKLVYRVDLMEKRLRKMEENLHYLVAGSEVKPEPCVMNYTWVGSGCYHFSSDSANWKNANYACRKLKGSLLELDTDDERRHLVSKLLAEKRLKGGDFWTGGLNPGLLWIWSHSARPVSSNATNSVNSTDPMTIVGEGRCLALVHDPAINSYVYRGQDCSLRHRYVCEKEEDKAKLSNEVERVARKIKEGKRKARIMWSDDD
ncbi:hypothetical protein K1T71_003588 [Dendrolimus kikuchii]|uniref:Uncharacterized protein n=1 Tax=Dendrolimus kikuchii TaxID=765133 RepID=A0ACC1DC39_9NEOP|nr:hypothetical protein K1T71_003588 [Dendrolimus kikuchii]